MTKRKLKQTVKVEEKVSALRELRSGIKRELHLKYSQYFNFYFAKSIDLIVDKVRSVARISFLDCNFYLDAQERLKRYYNKKESHVRLGNYAEYYNKLEDYHIPAFEIHSHKKIMFRRQKLKYRLRQ